MHHLLIHIFCLYEYSGIWRWMKSIGVSKELQGLRQHWPSTHWQRIYKLAKKNSWRSSTNKNRNLNNKSCSVKKCLGCSSVTAQVGEWEKLAHLLTEQWMSSEMYLFLCSSLWTWHSCFCCKSGWTLLHTEDLFGFKYNKIWKTNINVSKKIQS